MKKINRDPYRYERRIVHVVDFYDYYEDARAIGWRHTKALDYAFKAGLERIRELHEQVKNLS